MRRTLVALVVVAAGLMAPAAHAATTIGQVFTPTAQTSATVVQTQVTTGTGYIVPTNGVITSWSFQADTDGATVRLKTARRNPDGTLTIIGESDWQAAAPNQQSTFPTRIPVQAGDVIGTSSSTGKTVAFTGAADDHVLLAAGDQPAGTVLLPATSLPPGSPGTYSDVGQIRVDVTAAIEPDVDNDGFGDQTQDLCTTDASTQTRCQATLRLQATSDKRKVYPGGTVGFDLTVTNSGPSRSAGVIVLAQLSDELKLVSIDGAACSGSPITCKLGDLVKDQQVKLRIVASALRTGNGSIAAKAISNTADPNPSANAAGAMVAVTWRPGPCANVFTATAQNDVKRGTRAGDRIDGLLGNDVLIGLDGADCLSGGPGSDRLVGDDGNDTLEGGPGNDTIQGGAGNDQISGGAGSDRISGGSGADRIEGGSGNDRINAVDGKRDRVDCGSGGHDIVAADRGDRISHCEKVVYAKRR